MRVIEESRLRQTVFLNREVLSVIEEGFTRLSWGEVQTPPIMRLEIPQYHGEIDVKAALIQGIDDLAVKISSGFFDNPRRGLASGSGMMVVLSSETGYPVALLLDNGYLTDVRTAAAGAIAAKYLANDPVHTVGIIGSGSQARWQLQALSMVRAFKQVLVHSRHLEHAREFAKGMMEQLGIPVRVCDTAEMVVRESDIVVTCTPATEPIIQSEWIHAGLHITAMGADAESKQELDPQIVVMADTICCDLIVQCQRLGELHHALDAGVLSSSRVIELGELTSQKIVGRTHRDQVTVCDLTGTGVQDTMIAHYALQTIGKDRVIER